MWRQEISRKFFADITEVPEILKSSHLPSLDGLRGVSIIIVLIAHFNQYFHEPIMGAIFGNGVFGVYFFFVISGFLITTLLLKEKISMGTISLKKFYLRRFLRIFPLAYLFIAVIFVLNFILDLGISSSSFLVTLLYLVNFFHFFRTSYYFEHYWSLSVEEQFYALIPPFIKYRFNAYRYGIILMLGLTFLFRLVFKEDQTGFVSRLLFDLTRSLDGLLIGSFFSILVFANLIPWEVLKKYKVIINIILLGLIVICKDDAPNLMLRVFCNHTFYSILIGILIISNLNYSDDFIFKLLNSKILVQIGTVSYSIYIWQQFFTSKLLIRYYPYNIVMLLVTSFISYYFYERRFLKLKDKLKVN